MRYLTRTRLLAAIDTDGPEWVVPTRLALGALLLFPIDGSISQLLPQSLSASSFSPFGIVVAGMVLRGVEILAGIGFVTGFGIRLAAYPAVAIFALRSLANLANSFVGLRDAVSGFIVPRGDWAYGAMYLAVALLMSDLVATGSGRWSVDYWLCRKIKAEAALHRHHQ
jgi:uncharacterized membrane protein YphA (DoxX/SURF4 family)